MREFLDDMEDAGMLYWEETVLRWSVEFKKIGRGRERAMEREHKGYSSTAAFMQQKNAPPNSKDGTAVLISKYAAVLATRLNKLQTLVDDQSVLTVGLGTVASATVAALATTN